MTPTRRLIVLIAVVLALGASGASVSAGGQTPAETLAPVNVIQDFDGAELAHALVCLLVAAALGTLLAFRPRRGGAPAHPAHVVQAQIMMAVVGALVMLVVGASLARAFAIAGTAGLVRYRAKLDDPKDASVMLSCLAIGLASGVGLPYLAFAGALFIVALLWTLEWREPWPAKPFELKVSAKNPMELRGDVESLLSRHKIKFELREATEKHVAYMAQVPHGKRTDKVSEAITSLNGAQAVEVEWDEKKAK
jgi:hypothetical protein